MKPTVTYLLMEIHKFKAKDSEIVATPLCPLWNISKKFAVNNMNKTWLNWYVNDFSVDYDAIAVDNIHEYLMKKNGII